MSFKSRLTDNSADDDLDNFQPITGLKKEPLVTLYEAVKATCCKGGAVEDPDDQDALLLSANCSEMFAEGLDNAGALGPLTRDQAAAIHMYSQATPLYGKLNAALRSRNRVCMQPFYPFLKLFLSALYALPLCNETVLYRGVGLDFSEEYTKKKKSKVVWWSFSSTTTSLSVLNDPTFLPKTGDRTLFIAKVRAVEVVAYSALPHESERILLPGSVLHVEDILDTGHGLHQVEVHSVNTRPLLDYVHPEWDATLTPSGSMGSGAKRAKKKKGRRRRRRYYDDDYGDEDEEEEDYGDDDEEDPYDDEEDPYDDEEDPYDDEEDPYDDEEDPYDDEEDSYDDEEDPYDDYGEEDPYDDYGEEDPYDDYGEEDPYDDEDEDDYDEEPVRYKKSKKRSSKKKKGKKGWVKPSAKTKKKAKKGKNGKKGKKPSTTKKLKNIFSFKKSNKA